MVERVGEIAVEIANKFCVCIVNTSLDSVALSSTRLIRNQLDLMRFGRVNAGGNDLFGAIARPIIDKNKREVRMTPGIFQNRIKGCLNTRLLIVNRQNDTDITCFSQRCRSGMSTMS